MGSGIGSGQRDHLDLIEEEAMKVRDALHRALVLILLVSVMVPAGRQ